jgi:hypothetical protein
LKESDPVEVDFVLSGQRPTPCNLLRVATSGPNEGGHIRIDAYTVSNPDEMCIQVIEPFTAVIPFGKFTQGSYTLSINSQMQAKFSIP